MILMKLPSTTSTVIALLCIGSTTTVTHPVHVAAFTISDLPKQHNIISSFSRFSKSTTAIRSTNSLGHSHDESANDDDTSSSSKSTYSYSYSYRFSSSFSPLSIPSNEQEKSYLDEELEKEFNAQKSIIESNVLMNHNNYYNHYNNGVDNGKNVS